jgi:Zn-finger in ubiquitin-hydrolases and other protein
VTLSPVNVYVCLVCGKYFQGRGRSTVAYTHALETGHHMFMKLEDGRVQTAAPPSLLRDPNTEASKHWVPDAPRTVNPSPRALERGPARRDTRAATLRAEQRLAQRAAKP